MDPTIWQLNEIAPGAYDLYMNRLERLSQTPLNLWPDIIRLVQKDVREFAQARLGRECTFIPGMFYDMCDTLVGTTGYVYRNPVFTQPFGDVKLWTRYRAMDLWGPAGKCHVIDKDDKIVHRIEFILITKEPKDVAETPQRQAVS